MDDIDRLYQVPLAEFTAARNELAKRAGKAGADIRKLQKPNAAAWAVNQLYWQDRQTWDRLIRAAEDVREALRQQLAGRKADVNEAERAHQRALKDAAARGREFLEQSGDSATAATMAAVTDTLRSLPAPDPPGRLTRPLEPRGFEALAGILPRGAAGFPRAAERTEPPRRGGQAAPGRDRAAEKTAKREADARRRAEAKLTAELRKARTAERQAAAALDKARRSLQQAEQEEERLRDQLRFAARKVEETGEAVRREERAATEAEAARADIESELEALRGNTA